MIFRNNNGYILLFLLLVGLSRTALGQQPKPVSKPNVVIILADDQGWGDLSIDGNTNITTPHIDAMAQRGAAFMRFYVSPVCSPTRAELLTGRYHARSNVYSTSSGGERMDLDERTIAEVFKSSGYATGMMGKWHNGTQPPYHPNSRGFDEFYGFTSGHWGSDFFPMLDHNGKVVRGEGYLENDFTNKAMDFIETHRHQPFFLYLSYNTPHTPLQVPQRWWNQFKNKKLTMHNREPGRENTTFTKAVLAMSENIDWNVGRLQHKLQKLGLSRNTIVVYFSDNGPNSWRWNGGMKGKKGDVDEGGVRSPLFMTWPGHIKAGEVIPEISADIDLLPTLADLAGVEYKSMTGNPLDGRSLKPLLLGTEGPPRWPKRLLYSSWHDHSSVRSQTYRLDSNGKLYNMQQDPGQSYNMAPKRPVITGKLRDSLKSWQNRVLSTMDKQAHRPFTLGASESVYTQLPARDGVGHGEIERSNRWPNCSFFTHWTSVDDSITWNVNVLGEGTFKVSLYYTCPIKDIGSTIELKLGKHTLTSKINQAYDPPLRGMQHDRVKRKESYVKNWKRKNLGAIHLKKGTGQLTLKALTMPGTQVMDFRMVVFKRVER